MWPCEDFCQAGYKKWAPSNTVVFLQANGSWKHLCQNDFAFLENQLTATQVYSHFIFKTFSELESWEIKAHLQYIVFDEVEHDSGLKNERGCLVSSFLCSLENICCLHSTAGTNLLLPVSSFSDHTVEIIETFSDFLSDEYKEEKWMKFLPDWVTN